MSEITGFNINGQEVSISSSSENDIIFTGDDSSADFNIGDESGNVLVSFQDGHIKTKNFDSSSKNEISYQKLKICILGNSYTLDSFMYVPFIIKEYGIDIVIGIYYRPGASIQNHVDSYDSLAQAFYYIDTESDTKWKTLTSSTPKEVIEYEAWDIITLQQASLSSVTYDTYLYTRQLIDKILDSRNGTPVTFAWNINVNRLPGDDSSTYEESILNNIETICSREGINMIFPYGTAIFNARTNETLDTIADSNHLMSSDSVHLQEGIPCYIASLGIVQSLFNRFYPMFSVMGDATRPTQTMLSTWNVQGQHGSSVGVTEDNCRLAQICAVLANKKPFEIQTIYSE